MSDAYRDPLDRLRQLRGVLGKSVNAWEARTTAGANAAQVLAGNDAVDSVDAMLAILYEIRTQLVLERRADQDLHARRADQLIAQARSGRKDDQPRRILCAHADQNGEGMHWIKPGEICPAAERPGGDAR